jgi:dimeric dUTPase (all-alpha-NTP-PPase superfamily)
MTAQMIYPLEFMQRDIAEELKEHFLTIFTQIKFKFKKMNKVEVDLETIKELSVRCFHYLVEIGVKDDDIVTFRLGQANLPNPLKIS